MQYFLYQHSKKLRTLLIVAFLLINVFMFSGVASAVDLTGPLNNAGTGLGEKTIDANTALPTMIGSIIKVVLSILGVMLVVIIVYAGFLWMTAGGEKDQVEKAKDWIKNAVIGLALTLSAYVIASYVVAKLTGLGVETP